MSKKAVFGMAETLAHTEVMVDRLRDAGFAYDEISVIFHDRNRAHDVLYEGNTGAREEFGVVGAGAGAVLGGTLGFLVVSVIAIPGVGPFVVAGPLLAALGGGIIGAAVGSTAAALVSLGLTEFESEGYEKRLKEGKVLIAVHVDNEAEVEEVRTILEEAGADGISEPAQVPATGLRQAS